MEEALDLSFDRLLMMMMCYYVCVLCVCVFMCVCSCVCARAHVRTKRKNWLTFPLFFTMLHICGRIWHDAKENWVVGYFNVFLYNSIMSIFNLSFVSFFYPSVLVEKNDHICDLACTNEFQVPIPHNSFSTEQ